MEREILNFEIPILDDEMGEGTHYKKISLRRRITAEEVIEVVNSIFNDPYIKQQLNRRIKLKYEVQYYKKRKRII